MRRLALAAAVAVLAVTSVAGCGGARSTPTHSARAAVGQTPPSPADAHHYLVHAVGQTMAVHAKHVRSATTLSGNGVRHRQSADGHVGRRAGSSVVVVETDGARSEARVVGTDGWFSSGSPAVRDRLPKGRTWLSMPAGRMSASGVPTPQDQLSLLYVLWGLKSQHDAGPGVAGGIHTRRFTGTVDLDRATCAAPERTRTTLYALDSAAVRSGRPLQVEAWVDAYQLVRRLVITTHPAKDRTARYEVDLAGDNAAATVAAPPASGTVTLDSVPSLARAFPAKAAAPPRC